MPLSNFERMIALVNEVFATKNDPDQLDVNEEVMERLVQIHPSTICERDEGDGPVAWVLLIPTTRSLMDAFLSRSISEKELFGKTPVGGIYDALYLCSAIVLPEYRRKGIARELTLEAVADIRNEHPLTALFVWSFSKEGDLASEELSRITQLPLFKRL
ncbi:MAG TPA: GNAT family N-acetyltransferase [Catalimonadaceae bacterium]|nr:GNAT family N-acetyltransferase [Catalimonadaceae bacterium]HPI10988.1 GNAT family N-acetyltransferase [Catalimonadaceae bacterium]